MLLLLFKARGLVQQNVLKKQICFDLAKATIANKHCNFLEFMMTKLKSIFPYEILHAEDDHNSGLLCNHNNTKNRITCVTLFNFSYLSEHVEILWCGLFVVF